MKLRRLNKDDQKAIVAKAKSMCSGRTRVEFKDADQIEPPIAGCPFFCKPMGSSVDDFDSCSETLLKDVKIPDAGEFWVDVQVALNEELVGYEPSYEPTAWFKAIFKDGRLVEVTR